MAHLQVTIPTNFGTIQIYMNPRQQAKAERLIRETPKILTEAYKEASNTFGMRIVRMAKQCLQRGMPPPNSGVNWPPHTANTIKRLGEHTLLYWSSQYYQQIKLLQRGKQYAVGVTPGVKKTRPDHKVYHTPRTVSQVAKMLEFGSMDGTLPERRLWTVIWPSVGGDRAYKKVLVESIKQQLRKYK